MSPNLLEISGMHKSFGGLKVIDDVSFDVRLGSRTALIGPNGAGKTTIFNLICGMISPDFGSIRINSKIVNEYPIYQRTLMK